MLPTIRSAAIATLVMVFAAVYLLWMYQRVVFGELSDFLAGLGDHLTDMTPVETLTLVPLVPPCPCSTTCSTVGR